MFKDYHIYSHITDNEYCHQLAVLLRNINRFLKHLDYNFRLQRFIEGSIFITYHQYVTEVRVIAICIHNKAERGRLVYIYRLMNKYRL